MARSWLIAGMHAACAMTLTAAMVAAQNSGPPEGLRTRTMHQGELAQPKDPLAFKKPKRGEIRLKDAEVVRGTHTIAAAWFSEPSPRYRHMPFGGDQHPTALTVSTKEQRLLKFQLPKDSVFEDRLPRLVDLDGDGQEEIVVVRAYERRGAALAILAIRGNELQIIAETPPIGIPFRWLNPAGFGDFDGDGQIDIALVQTPHLEGELQIWTLREGKLVQIASTGDVSNHVFGSMHQKLSVVADFNGDGRPDIAIPSKDRYALRFLTLLKDELEELGVARLPAAAAEDFSLTVVNAKPSVRVGLAGGRAVVVSPCRDVQDWEMADGGC